MAPSVLPEAVITATLCTARNPMQSGRDFVPRDRHGLIASHGEEERGQVLGRPVHDTFLDEPFGIGTFLTSDLAICPEIQMDQKRCFTS